MGEGKLGGVYSTYREEGRRTKQAFNGEVKGKGKGKVIPLQARCGPEGG